MSCVPSVTPLISPKLVTIVDIPKTDASIGAKPCPSYMDGNIKALHLLIVLNGFELYPTIWMYGKLVETASISSLNSPSPIIYSSASLQYFSLKSLKASIS